MSALTSDVLDYGARLRSKAVFARSPAVKFQQETLRLGDEAIQNLANGMSVKTPCVYILASKRNGTLYTGVTADLQKRLHEHRSGVVEGFTKKYGVYRLVYYEVYEDMYSAITREKQIKGGSRSKKLALIEKDNPLWRDLSGEI